jgi:exportin-T
VSERRQELFVLFRAAARVAPAEAHAAVGARLQAALGSPGASAQEVEVAVTLLYQLGEGAPDEALRPGTGALGQMAAGLMAADVPAGGHPLVALALLETFIRYLRCARAYPNPIPIITLPYALLGPLLPCCEARLARRAAVSGVAAPRASAAAVPA